MSLATIEKMAEELPPREQMRLIAHLSERLANEEQPGDAQRRKERMLAALTFCDEVAESIAGEFDSAEDLRRIRRERIADIDRAVD